MSARSRTRCLSRRLTRLPERSRKKATALTVTSAAWALLLSGCGLLPGQASASNDPITVMTWAPQGTKATNMPGMPAMAKAYARWVNASGGINGRRLEVLTCNEHNDTVEAAHCAERAVDEDVVAVVGSYSHHGRAFMSPLEGAGIPYVGGYGITEEEFTSPLSYPVNGGLPSLVAGLGRQLAASGCDHVSLVRPDNVSGDLLPPLLNAGLRDGGAPASAIPVTDVRAPWDATSYREEALSALSGARAATNAALPGTALAEERSCVATVLGGHTDTFFDSYRRLTSDGTEVTTASVLGSIQQRLVDATGGANSPLEGTYATGWYPASDDPRWDQMKTVVREYAFKDDRIDINSPGVRTTWVAYTVLRAALESLGEDTPVTAHALREVLDEGKAISTGGLTPDLRWHFEDLLAAHEFPRIVNTKVTYQRVRGGRLQSVRDGFVNVEKSLESDYGD